MHTIVDVDQEFAAAVIKECHERLQQRFGWNQESSNEMLLGHCVTWMRLHGWSEARVAEYVNRILQEISPHVPSNVIRLPG